MKRRIFVIVLVFVLILIALLVIAWLQVPLAGDFSPPDGTEKVPVRSVIQISFSEPMQAETIESRLSTDPERSGSFVWEDSRLTFTPDKPWPAGSLVQVQLKPGGRAQAGLGLPMLTSYQWSFQTAQARLAYLWPSDAPADLYTLDPLSGEVDRLTEGENIYDYSISSDGMTIFLSAGNAHTGADLYRLDILQTISQADTPLTLELVLSCEHIACRAPHVSPDGKWLAYERVDPDASLGAQVWLLDLVTNQASRLGAEGHFTEQPCWSPGGLLVFYDQQQAAYIFVDLTDGKRFEAPNSTGQGGTWSPDGSAFLAPEIIYVSSQGAPLLGSSRLIRYTPFGSSIDLTSADNIEDANPVYAPDGGTIVFGRKYLDVADWSFGRQLWLMDADGSGQRQITRDDVYNHYDFAWSWDGKWLAYVRFNNASYADLPELWLRDADGSNPIQLNYGGYAPQWIP